MEVGWGGGRGVCQEGGRDPAAACCGTVRISRRCRYGGRGAARGNATAASGAAAAAVGCRRRPLHRYPLLPLLLPTSGAAAGASTAACGVGSCCSVGDPGLASRDTVPGARKPRPQASGRALRAWRSSAAGRQGGQRSGAACARGAGAEYRDGGRGGEGERAEKRGNEERKEEEKEEKQGTEGREEERKMKSERRVAGGGGGGGGIRQGREGGGEGQWLTNRRTVCGPRGAARGEGPCFHRQPPSDSASGLKMTSMEAAILFQRHTLGVPLRGQPCPFCSIFQEGPTSGSQVMPRPARREARER